MFDPEKENEDRAYQLLINALKEDPDMKELFDQLTKALDELFELNKDAMAKLGTAITKACLRNVDTMTLDPNEIFKDAVHKAQEIINSFAKVQHLKTLDMVLEIADKHKTDEEETA